MNRIEINNLTKRYGRTTALDNISLTFEEGKIYGLLGRNGAGKTTLLNLMTNRIFPDAGEILLNGIPAAESDDAQNCLYMMSEHNYFPENDKAADVFRWTGEFYPSFDREKALELCEKFKLDPKKKAKKLSTGYGTILRSVTALCANTPFTLLDEPVLGLDANHRELLYRTILEMYGQNPRTFVISTHLIDEISGIIGDIVILKSGTVIKNQSCDELLGSGYTAAGPASLIDEFIRDKTVIHTERLGGLCSASILGKPDKSGLPDGIEIAGLDLQKLFIRLTDE